VKYGIATLIPVPPDGTETEQVFLCRGVGVDASLLPYLPDMEEGSDFCQNGNWHHYKIQMSLFIIYFEKDKYFEVFHVVLFGDEETPRILNDQRGYLLKKGILSPNDVTKINQLIAEKGLS
jgi:hypothetical protein